MRVLNAPNSEPRPLLDRSDRIYSVLVGQPRGGAYLDAACRCHRAILEEGRREHFEPEEQQHRRGNFPAINIGITHGMGLPVPTNLVNEGHREMVERLLADADIKRLATFASGAFLATPRAPVSRLTHYRQLRLQPGPLASTVTTRSAWTNYGPASLTSGETSLRASSLAQHSTSAPLPVHTSTGMH